jgi:hypothetical protein
MSEMAAIFMQSKLAEERNSGNILCMRDQWRGLAGGRRGHQDGVLS